MGDEFQKESLRRLPLFEGLEESDLDGLLAAARVLVLEPGQTLLREGDPGDEMYVVLEGDLEVSRRHGKVENVVAHRTAREVVGEMALLEQAPRSATVRAATQTRLLGVSREAFDALLSCSPTARSNILRTVVGRLRSMESAFMQREKVAALGTMAAGLAHELNNPAAALKRSGEELRGSMDRRDLAFRNLFGAPLTADERALALDLSLRTSERELARTAAAGALDARSPDPALEEALEGVLSSYGVQRPWDAAASLSDGGWSVEAVERLLNGFSERHRSLVLAWLAADATCRSLLQEIRNSSVAISTLVGAVKQYAYMDRALVNDVDVHAGLNNTLVMLKHKLKHGIDVVRDFDAALPAIEAHGSELNQVWTNLIDNAAAAMGGSGTLTLRTRHDGDQVVVEIMDSGPGIPADALPHLFEPFFTTKEVGEGTGLGLYIAWNVVVQNHGGELTVESAPGSTTFRVTLPRSLRAPAIEG